MAHRRDDADDDARADALSADAYPGVPGATKAEVDDFLRALDDFQPVVRADATRRRRGAKRAIDKRAIQTASTRD